MKNSTDSPEWEEVEYNCTNCNTIFVVFNYKKQRNTYCSCCLHPILQTGRIRFVKDGEVIVQLHGVEIDRYKSKYKE